MKRIMTGLFLVAALALPLSLISAQPASAQVSVGLSVSVGPPVLPIYAQPVIPGPGYLWVPGYWAYGPYGYYWVPGAWELPPTVGFLWTPGYWGWNAGYYRWYPGYWGRHVGFYGGIYYGHGYNGQGYHGGYWHNNHFYYNSAVNNLNRGKIRYTYSKPVPAPRETRRVSYNGGKGGIDRRPTAQERAWSQERHVGLTATQKQRREQAQRKPEMRYNNNHGKPPVGSRVEHAKPQTQKYSSKPPSYEKRNETRNQNEKQNEKHKEKKPENKPPPEDKRPAV